MKLKTGDLVQVITGKDKGKEGKILKVDRKNNKVLIEGINVVKKHTKPNAKAQQGGILEVESLIDASNVMYVHNNKPTRLGTKVVQEERNGKMKNVRLRVAKTTGEVVDK